MRTDVSALFVDPRGLYPGLVADWWDEKRDARKYAGPNPVVAHPPCSRWCRLAGLVEARWGHKRGEDGGCFKSALTSVRRFGGVLEHPAYSDAWSAFDLPMPPTGGGWQAGFCGGCACYVEQHRYGHPAKKATWLYCFGVNPPSLKWGFLSDNEAQPTALVSWCGNRVKNGEVRPRLGKRAANHSPLAFAELLVSIAAQAKPARRAV